MSLKITKLFVEYQEQPLGLDEAVPRFSWLLTSTKQNVLQIACRIQVFNLDVGGTDAPDKCVWDSGKEKYRNGMKQKDFVDVRIIQLQEIYHNMTAEYDLLMDEIPFHRQKVRF